ncbi:hypothetical protein CPB86DRAFT_376022 [Serendipita vermifera]|nr:hypothetical protein CPB86DRAFT_376022 [Serendipita vermifera]
MAKSQSPTLSSTSPPSLDPTAVGPIRHIRPRTHSRQTSGSLSTVSFNERADEPVTSPPLRHSISPSPPFFEPTSPLLAPVPTSNEQQHLHHSHVFDYTMPTLAEEDDASSTPGASSHDQSAPSTTGIGNGEEGASLVKLPTGKWQCPHCQKLFRRRDRAQAHVNVHVNTRPYSCDGSCGNHLCDRSYFSQESLQSHTQHAMIICETCGKELRKKNISRHRKRYCIVKSSTS